MTLRTNTVAIATRERERERESNSRTDLLHNSAFPCNDNVSSSLRASKASVAKQGKAEVSLVI